MTNQALIERAASIVKPRKTKQGTFGDVGCALVADNDAIYVGICADVGPNGFCAEQNAIGSMITDGFFRIKRLVAVWKDEQGGVFVIPPCGNCRQFMRDIDERNLLTEVVLNRDKAVPLSDLLPYHDWWREQG
jgi:cytidine deaminase